MFLLINILRQYHWYYIHLINSQFCRGLFSVWFAVAGRRGKVANAHVKIEERTHANIVTHNRIRKLFGMACYFSLGQLMGLSVVAQRFCFCYVMKIYIPFLPQSRIQTKLSLRTWKNKQLILLYCCINNFMLYRFS